MRRAAKRREGWRFAIALSTSVVAAVVICLAMNWDLGRRGPFGIVLAATTADRRDNAAVAARRPPDPCA